MCQQQPSLPPTHDARVLIACRLGVLRKAVGCPIDCSLSAYYQLDGTEKKKRTGTWNGRKAVKEEVGEEEET